MLLWPRVHLAPSVVRCWTASDVPSSPQRPHPLESAQRSLIGRTPVVANRSASHPVRLMLWYRLILSCSSVTISLGIATLHELFRRWPMLALLFALLLAVPALPVSEGDHVIRDFKFASGETLPELRIHYRTLG